MQIGSNKAIKVLTAVCGVCMALALRSEKVAAVPQAPEFVHVAPAKAISATSGAATTVIVKLTIDKGYHLQGNNAKDPYIPTTATVQAPEGVAVGKIVYPPSVKKDFSGETIPVYEAKVEIKIPITISKTVKSGDLKLPVTINYQGCNEKSCFPPTKLTTNVEIKVAAR